MAKQSKKALENKVYALAWKALAAFGPIPIMETVKVSNVGLKAAAEGKDDDGILAAINAYLQNLADKEALEDFNYVGSRHHY